MWQRLGNSDTVEQAGWPQFDPELIKEDMITIVIQVNGKVRDKILVPAGSTDDQVIQKVFESERIAKIVGEVRLRESKKR